MRKLILLLSMISMLSYSFKINIRTGGMFGVYTTSQTKHPDLLPILPNFKKYEATIVPNNSSQTLFTGSGLIDIDALAELNTGIYFGLGLRTHIGYGEIKNSYYNTDPELQDKLKETFGLKNKFIIGYIGPYGTLGYSYRVNNIFDIRLGFKTGVGAMITHDDLAFAKYIKDEINIDDSIILKTPKTYVDLSMPLSLVLGFDIDKFSIELEGGFNVIMTRDIDFKKLQEIEDNKNKLTKEQYLNRLQKAMIDSNKLAYDINIIERTLISYTNGTATINYKVKYEPKASMFFGITMGYIIR